MQSAVVSLKKIFEPGMAYVALSRTTSLHGLHITDFEDKKIYADPAITASLQSMRRARVEEIMPLLQHVKENRQERTLTLVHHNTEGLASHMEDIRCHHELQHADVLCLTENAPGPDRVLHQIFNWKDTTCLHATDMSPTLHIRKLERKMEVESQYIARSTFQLSPGNIYKM